MEIEFYSIYGPASLLMIIVGIGIRKYLKRTKMNDHRRVLSASAYWLNLSSIFIIFLGIIAMISVLTAFYFDLKLNDYI